MAKLIVNLIGAPATRKSTTAFALFAELKKRGINCEVAAEVAKEYVFENNKNALEYQLIVWASQAYRLWNAANHTDIVLCDAPLLLGLIYLTSASVSMCNVILEEHHKYTSLNILMPFRVDDIYSMSGRVHNFTEAETIHQNIQDVLDIHNIPFIRYEDYTEHELVSIILEASEAL